jgi:hypothetical protein
MLPLPLEIAACATGLMLGGCMTPTPFGDDVDEHQLNRAAIRSLQGPPSSERFRFVALGDSHDAYDELSQAVTVINRLPDVGFVAHAGDVSQYGLAQEYEWNARALSGLRIPALVAIGNHDAISNGPAVYRELYGPFDFSFRYGKYKLVFFNSNALEFDGAAPDRAWLEGALSDLEGASSAILVTHQNLEAPDVRAGSDDAAFYEHLVTSYPISLVVHGHLDAFELSAWHQVPKLQLGTFRKTYQFSVVSISESQVDVDLCDTTGCLPTRSLELGTQAREMSP